MVVLGFDALRNIAVTVLLFEHMQDKGNARELKEAYARGENITSLLRTEQGTSANSEEIIEIAYDLQAGRYIAALEKPGPRQR